MKRLLFLCLLLVSCVNAATWYVSPSATAGSGTLNDPWSIYTALTSGSVSGGDTIYLRGGTYQGSGFACTISGNASPVTIRSYPGEWAVLTDGVIGYLGTTMDATTSPIIITNSEHYRSTQQVGIDNEVVQLSNTSGSPTNWAVNRGWNGTTATAHSAGARTAIYNYYVLDHQLATNVVFRDFEITSPGSTNRVVTYNTSFAAGLNLGVSDKAINLILHDVGQPGIGAFVHTPGGYEINGCLIWGVGMFDTTFGTSEYRGSGIYAQNEGGGGLAIVKNCLLFRQTTAGAKVFGETGPVRDFQFNQCAAFMNGTAPLAIESGSTATSNTWMNGCMVMGQPQISYVSLGNTKQYFVNNVEVSGGLAMKETTNSTVTNNIIFMVKGSGDSVSPVQWTSTHISSNDMNLDWDRNTYYVGDGATIEQWGYASLEGNVAGGLPFGGSARSWQQITKLDANSTTNINWGATFQRVTAWPLDYDANRRFVTVVSMTGQTNITLDLSTNGFSSGDGYVLRDAQNYFQVLRTGTYGGSAINLPLNLTNIAALQGSVTNFVPQHTDVANPGLFNVFVLDRVSQTLSVSVLNVGSIR